MVKKAIGRPPKDKVLGSVRHQNESEVKRMQDEIQALKSQVALLSVSPITDAAGGVDINIVSQLHSNSQLIPKHEASAFRTEDHNVDEIGINDASVNKTPIRIVDVDSLDMIPSVSEYVCLANEKSDSSEEAIEDVHSIHRCCKSPSTPARRSIEPPVCASPRSIMLRDVTQLNMDGLSLGVKGSLTMFCSTLRQNYYGVLISLMEFLVSCSSEQLKEALSGCNVIRNTACIKRIVKQADIVAGFENDEVRLTYLKTCLRSVLAQCSIARATRSLVGPRRSLKTRTARRRPSKEPKQSSGGEV